MFYGQCDKCGERWRLGTASSCKCPVMSKTVIQMAKEAGFPFAKFGLLRGDDNGEIDADQMLELFAELVRADERNSWPAEMVAMERQVNILTDALAEHAPVQQEPVGIVKDLFTNAAWDKLDVVGSTKVYLDFPPAQQEPLAWGIIASNTGRLCQVELDAGEVEGHNPKHIVPLCRCSQAPKENQS